MYPGLADSTDPHADPKQAGNSYQVVTVTNPGGYALHGWLFANPGDHGTVLVLGGNAMNTSAAYAASKYLLGHGFRVLVFTYQGFGDNGGHADVASVLGDAKAFYVYAQASYKDEPIGFFGSSTGAVAALCLGAKESLSAIVADSAYNPKTIVADKRLWLAIPFESAFASGVPDDLDTSRCLQELHSTPVLFIHNRSDPMVPFAVGQRLADEYRGPKEFVETIKLPESQAHMSAQFDPAAQQQILAFLEQHLH